MTVVPYVIEEVYRQGHDTYAFADGGRRVAWMLTAWDYAWDRRERLPTLQDAQRLGQLIEPQKNRHGWRTVPVWVGTRQCPEASTLVPSLEALFTPPFDQAPLNFYRAFLEIHPFVDGNGRTGKVLLNWRNGTLDDPIFPPHDFWGHPIRNP